MWIFATKGFVSIVDGGPDLLVARARFKGDLEKLFPAADGAVQCTPRRDYRYRVTMSREYAATVVANLLRDIDYPNFKDACPRDRHPPYLRVWAVMDEAQERAAVTQASNIRATDVTCPACGSQPGQRCSPSKRGRSHKLRRDLARAQPASAPR